MLANHCSGQKRSATFSLLSDIIPDPFRHKQLKANTGCEILCYTLQDTRLSVIGAACTNDWLVRCRL